MSPPPNPLVYQINPDLIVANGQNLSYIPDEILKELSDLGFDYIYILGIWPSSQGALDHSIEKLKGVIPQDDVRPSPFAISSYAPREDVIGGVAGLTTFRERLNQFGMKLMVDFVPNHMTVDHVWVKENPDLLVQGSNALFDSEPQNYFNVQGNVIAHGRDPFFSGWKDTCQLNYASTNLRERMCDILVKISKMADCVRCDMAMLPLNEIFLNTWSKVLELKNNLTNSDLLEKCDSGVSFKPGTPEFWTEAIAKCRDVNPDFVFVAEVYWDKEWQLQQLGFDFCYDKSLYDRLQSNDSGAAVTAHLFHGDLKFQKKLVRFLENHDEPRASNVFGKLSLSKPTKHRAAAIVTYTSCGMRFFHEGQLHGRNQFVSMHSQFRPPELLEGAALVFYKDLIKLLARVDEVHHGHCAAGVVAPSDDQDPSFSSIHVSFLWLPRATRKVEPYGLGDSRSCIMVLSNLSNHQSHGHVRLPDSSAQADSLRSIFPTDNQGHVVIMSDVISAPASATSEFVVDRPITVNALLNDQNSGERAWFSLDPWETHVYRLSVVQISI